MADEPARGQLGPKEASWAQVIERLEGEKARLYEEIRAYPTPITACDLQFNALLERQTAIVAELARIRSAMQRADARG